MTHISPGSNEVLGSYAADVQLPATYRTHTKLWSSTSLETKILSLAYC
jgi:hypothetical protein